MGRFAERLPGVELDINPLIIGAGRGVPTAAGTMTFVTFVFFQAFNLLNVRDDIRSVFSR